MGDSLKKAQAGQALQIPAEAYNAFLDAVRFVKEHRHDVGQDASDPLRQSGIIKVRNKSGAARERFDLLMIDEPIISPADNLQQFKNQVTFEGYEPGEKALPTDDKEPVLCRRFVILLEPSPVDGIGRATLAGASVARVDVIRESDRYAELETSNSSSLRSSPFGSTRILWKESGLGLKWAVVRLSDRPRIGLFELGGDWIVGDPNADPPEPENWAKNPNAKPVLFVSSTGTYEADINEPAQTIWHAAAYPQGERTTLRQLHESDGLFPAKYGQGDWVWCLFNEQEGRWQLLEGYEDHWRFRLVDELASCGSAQAELVLEKPSGFCPTNVTFTVHDSVGVVAWCGCEGGSEATSAPAGTYGIAKYFADSRKWEVIALGKGCCDGSSSSGSSSSDPSSSSSSGSSSSGSSSSSQSSSSESSSSSSSSSDSSSSSESSSSEGSSSSGGSSSCPPPEGEVVIYETDIRCESDKLNVYTREVTLSFEDNRLKRTTGSWVFSHQAGCCGCCCDSSSSSSSSSNSSSSSSSSGSSSGFVPSSMQDP